MGTSSRGLVARAGTLRISLLVSLGVSPLACGGTALTSSDGTVGTTQGGTAQGGTAQGGAAQAGAGGDLPGVAGSYAGSVALAGAGGTISIAGSTGLGGGGGKPSRVPVCDLPVEDPLTHVVSCSNGIVHRPEAVACTLPPGVGGGPGAAGSGGASAGTSGTAGGPPQCTSDADCAGSELGYCHTTPVQPGVPAVHSCQSGCLQDSDCNNGICLCDGSPHGGTCRYSHCKIDADCGKGFFCSPADSVCGESTPFQCLKADDQCWTSADCSNGAVHSAAPCVASADGTRSCFTGACGRPFLVEETARLADVIARGDWLAPDLRPDLLGLSPLERADLAAHWARLGQMEHASIAAFARFNLQLLSLGAPAGLIEGCNRALIDETRHARQCFALASQYGGVPVGSGPLNMQGCFESADLASVMKLVLSEGCIGETVAALDAMEQAATASDHVVRSVLSGIARDEQSHAELAFRFMRWALAQCSAELRSEMAREADARLSVFECSVDGVRFTAAREVVRPLLAALFQESALSVRGAAPGGA